MVNENPNYICFSKRKPRQDNVRNPIKRLLEQEIVNDLLNCLCIVRYSLKTFWYFETWSHLWLGSIFSKQYRQRISKARMNHCSSLSTQQYNWETPPYPLLFQILYIILAPLFYFSNCFKLFPFSLMQLRVRAIFLKLCACLAYLVDVCA